ncbi:hypothetical protein Dimus_023307 [Dionaea muscipula]
MKPSRRFIHFTVMKNVIPRFGKRDTSKLLGLDIYGSLNGKEILPLPQITQPLTPTFTLSSSSIFTSLADGGRGPARRTAAKSVVETSIATVVGDVRAARFAPAKHIPVKGWTITFRRAGNCRRACGFIGCRCRLAGRALSGWRSVGSERSVVDDNADIVLSMLLSSSGRAFGSESCFGMDFCPTCGNLLQYDKMPEVFT